MRLPLHAHDALVADVNPRFFDITGHPRDRPLSEWRNCVWDEDQVKLDEHHNMAVLSQKPWTEWDSLEIRFKNRVNGWGQFGQFERCLSS